MAAARSRDGFHPRAQHQEPTRGAATRQDRRAPRRDRSVHRATTGSDVGDDVQPAEPCRAANILTSAQEEASPALGASDFESRSKARQSIAFGVPM